MQIYIYVFIEKYILCQGWHTYIIVALYNKKKNI